MLARYPFHKVSIDFVSFSDHTGSGKKWLLTCLDLFTRYPMAMVMKERNSMAIMRALNSMLWTKHGFSEIIICDREPGFVSEAIRTARNAYIVMRIVPTNNRLVTKGEPC
jgi:hypothetical protein